jgi:hypothetical protein
MHAVKSLPVAHKFPMLVQNFQLLAMSVLVPILPGACTSWALLHVLNLGVYCHCYEPICFSTSWDAVVVND